MTTPPVKIVVDQLISDLQHRPKDFHCTENHIRDKESKLTYCLGSQWFDSGIDSPFKMDFGPWHGWRFHRALKKWKAWKVVDMTNGTS